VSIINVWHRFKRPLSDLRATDNQFVDTRYIQVAFKTIIGLCKLYTLPHLCCGIRITYIHILCMWIITKLRQTPSITQLKKTRFFFIYSNNMRVYTIFYAFFFTYIVYYNFFFYVELLQARSK
jgi:hypothetical protein